MSYFSLFQSTHPARGATRSGFLTPTVDQFQSTHPARGATFRCLDKKPLFGFQSTHPARGATRRYVCTNEGWRFQSTHPARGATSGHVAHLRLDAIISIHAPREGCDRPHRSCRPRPPPDFNPRTPRGVRPMSSLSRSRASLHFNPRTQRGVRPVPSPTGWASLKFQSTHPARGATPRRMVQNRHGAISIHAPREGCDVQIGRRAQDDAKHFNPRTPRGVRPLIMDAFIANANFNPRTPRGVRRTTGVNLGIPQRFQSTHPARGATIGIPAGHNPLLYFNPRTPRGVRPTSAWPLTGPSIFQSTHPARGATLPLFPRDRIARAISIHAPREGCDRPCCTSETGRRYFNPRTPRGVRRLLVLWKLKGWNHFNPRTPRGVRPFAIGQRIILT